MYLTIWIMRDLIFNKDYEFPLITRGWNDLKTVNNLPDNVEVKLTTTVQGFPAFILTNQFPQQL
jgi:hypothetical protein